VFFGILYHILPQGDLVRTLEREQVSGLKDAIYFSFITATTTGFGDIIPHGINKGVAIIQVVFGLLLLAMVTSKFVGIKQEVILKEIYEISFTERINRLRSSLLLFRQHMGRVVHTLDKRGVREKEVLHEVHGYIAQLNDTLKEIELLMRQKGKHFTMTIDKLNAEILLNSSVQSMEKLDELLRRFESKKMNWRPALAPLTRDSMLVMERVVHGARGLKIEESILEDVEQHRNKLLGRLGRKYPSPAKHL
jgi:hypothetical protein